MDNSHSKEIALGRTTVKIPGGRPRGSEVPRTVPPTSSNGQLSNADSSTASKLTSLMNPIEKFLITS